MIKIYIECRFYLLKKVCIYILSDSQDNGMLAVGNMQFSTPDMVTFCTLRIKPGWWHSHCTHSNLNGLYSVGVSGIDPMFWYGFKQYTGLKKASMKIKKRNKEYMFHNRFFRYRIRSYLL